MNAFKEWWQQASSRDQLALVALAIAVAIYLLFMGVLRPVSDLAKEQEQRNVAQQQSFERVKNLAAQWKAHNASGGDDNRAQNAERMVETSIAQYGIHVSGFDASGRNTVRVRVDRVAYEDFVRWVYDLEVSRGLRIKDVSVAATQDSGVVSVSLTVEK